MKTIGLLIAIFVAEFTWSYCASRVTNHLVKGEVLRTVLYDASALLIAYEILAVLSKENFSQPYIIVAVIGGSLGTGKVALEEKKSKSKKKVSSKTTQTQVITTPEQSIDGQGI